MVSANTPRADIYKAFMSAVITSVSTNTSATVTQAFVNDKAFLPQVVLHPVTLSKQREAFGTSGPAYMREGNLLIEVYSESTQEVVELLDLLEKNLFNNLASLGVDNLTINEGSSDTFDLSGRTIRVMNYPMSFRYRG